MSINNRFSDCSAREVARDCLDGVTDEGMIDMCMDTYQICADVVCVGVDMSQVDTSCLPL